MVTTAFITFLFLWVALNTWVLLTRPFDAYPFLLLSTVLFTVAVIASWKNDTRPKLFLVLLLLLETGVNGTLCSLDYVMFMIFWAMELVPAFLLIAIWGGAGRARAAQRYLVYGLISLVLLLASAMLPIAGRCSRSRRWPPASGPLTAFRCVSGHR